MPSPSRAVIDALMPRGTAWSPEEGAGLDQLLDGMAANQERLRLFLATLADLRNPMFTPILADLEREFGILPDLAADEATRRARLQSAKAAGNGDGSLGFMQSRLQAAGFNVNVYQNDPPVDPAGLLHAGSSRMFGDSSALVGRECFGAQTTGVLLVNGPLAYNRRPSPTRRPPMPVTGRWCPSSAGLSHVAVAGGLRGLPSRPFL